MKKRLIIAPVLAGLLSSSLMADEIKTLNVRAAYADSTVGKAVIGDVNKGVNILITALDEDGDPADEDTDGEDLPSFTSSQVTSSLGADVTIQKDQLQFTRANIADYGIARAYISYEGIEGYASSDTITVTVGGLTETVTVNLAAQDADRLYLRTADGTIDYTQYNHVDITTIDNPVNDIHEMQGEAPGRASSAPGASVDILVFASRDGNFTAAPNLEGQTVTITAHRADTNGTLCTTTATMNNGVATADLTTSNCSSPYSLGKLHGKDKIFFSAKVTDKTTGSTVQTETPNSGDSVGATATKTYDYMKYDMSDVTPTKILPCFPYNANYCVPRTMSSSSYKLTIPGSTNTTVDKNSGTIRFMATDTYGNVVDSYGAKYTIAISDANATEDFNITSVSNGTINTTQDEANVTFVAGVKYVDVVMESNGSMGADSVASLKFTTFLAALPDDEISTTPTVILQSFEGNTAETAGYYDINITAYVTDSDYKSEGNATSGAEIKFVIEGDAITNGTAGTDIGIYTPYGNGISFENSTSSSATIETADKAVKSLGTLSTSGAYAKEIKFKVHGSGDATVQGMRVILDGADLNASHFVSQDHTVDTKLLDTTDGQGFQVVPNTSTFTLASDMEFNLTRIENLNENTIDLNSTLDGNITNEELYIDYFTNVVNDIVYVKAPVIAKGSDINYTILNDLLGDLIIYDGGGNKMDATSSHYNVSGSGLTAYKGSSDLNISIPASSTTTPKLTIKVNENSNVYKIIQFDNVIRVKAPTKFTMEDITSTTSSGYTLANGEKVVVVNTDYNDGNPIFYRIEAEEDGLDCDVSLWNLTQPYASPLGQRLGEDADAAYGTSNDVVDSTVTMALGETNVTTFVVRCDEEDEVKLRISDLNDTIDSAEISLGFVGGSYTGVSVTSLPASMCKGESATITASGGQGDYTASGSPTTLADVSESGGTVTVAAKLAGSLTVTVSDGITSTTVTTTISECSQVSLSSGWNMISGALSSVSNVSDYMSAWVYDGDDQEWEEEPASLSEGEGAWVKVAKASHFTLGVPSYTSTTEFLNAKDMDSNHWYLLGAPIELDIESISAYGDKFWTYDASTKTWSDTESGTLAAGRGFWLRAD